MPQIKVVVPACVGQMLVTKYKNKRKYKGFQNIYLNMNNYRNWNGFFEGKVKKRFYSLVAEELERVPVMKTINLIQYNLIQTTAQKRDRNNVYSVVDKYFCDALQYFGKIKDDDDSTILDITMKLPEYIKDKAENIRVLITIVYDE